ncbi:MAG TPA: NUDIX domain-containing protein [Allosphingosinicella sp.]|jgi:ADP-ribose pyrophosphatase YjhB (NUDIX family)
MLRPLLLVGLRLGYRLTRALLKAAGVERPGVHAVPITPDGRVVLVRLTYAPGWRIPGGGAKKGEAREEGVLRELREEIGLVSWSRIEPLRDLPPQADRAAEESDFFVLRNVVYEPRRNLEIEEVGAFEPSALPEEMRPEVRELIAAALASRGEPSA